MSKKLRVAVIGCGNIGEVHAQRYAACPNAEVARVVDIVPEKARKLAAAVGGARAGTDWREALADPAVDAVSVCLPNDLHCPATLDALQAGKHVLCEKPIALSMAEAERMSAAAGKAGKLLAIGVVNRFNDYVNLVRDEIRAGALGELYHVNFSFKAYRSIPGLGGWFTTKARAGGGVMIDWGIHFLDLVLYCIGGAQPRSISGVAHSRLARDPKEYTYLSMWAQPDQPQGGSDVEEYASGLLRTAGPSISFEGAWAQNVNAPAMWIDFFGDKGGIRLSYGKEYTLYTARGGALYETRSQRSDTDMYQNEMADFVDCCLTGRQSRARIDDVIVSQKIIDGFYRSSETGKEVQL
jgi:predicted dehydrogenase